MIKAVITPVTVFTVALFLTLGACLNWIALVIQILILKRASFVIGEDGLGVPWYEAPPSLWLPDLLRIAGAAAGCTVGAWLLLSYRRRLLRARNGLCARCGYDLRASPGRFPECGREYPPSLPVMSHTKM
jgi:hypothetical protein